MQVEEVCCRNLLNGLKDRLHRAVCTCGVCARAPCPRAFNRFAASDKKAKEGWRRRSGLFKMVSGMIAIARSCVLLRSDSPMADFLLFAENEAWIGPFKTNANLIKTEFRTIFLSLFYPKGFRLITTSERGCCFA